MGCSRMKFKRNEAFRYEFGVPVPLSFIIQKINGTEVRSSSGHAKLLDISPSGMKIESDLVLPKKHDIELLFTVRIGKTEIEVRGKVVWQKQFGQLFQYGIFLLDKETEDSIIDALKELQRKVRNRK